VLVALVAPNVLRGYFELNIVLVLLALLRRRSSPAPVAGSRWPPRSSPAGSQ